MIYYRAVMILMRIWHVLLSSYHCSDAKILRLLYWLMVGCVFNIWYSIKTCHLSCDQSEKQKIVFTFSMSSFVWHVNFPLSLAICCRRPSLSADSPVVSFFYLLIHVVICYSLLILHLSSALYVTGNRWV